MTEEVDDKVAELLAEREVVEDIRGRLSDRDWDITTELCDIKGFCPLCLNTHYPHCGIDSI